MQDATFSFRRLIECEPDLTSVLDASGKIVCGSPGRAATLGFDPQEMLGTSVFTLVHPDDLALVEERFARLLRKPGAVMAAVFRCRCKDGTWRHLDARARNLLHHAEVGGVLVSARDVTEWVQVREELASLKDHLQARVEARVAELREANARL